VAHEHGQAFLMEEMSTHAAATLRQHSHRCGVKEVVANGTLFEIAAAVVCVSCDVVGEVVVPAGGPSAWSALMLLRWGGEAPASAKPAVLSGVAPPARRGTWGAVRDEEAAREAGAIRTDRGRRQIPVHLVVCARAPSDIPQGLLVAWSLWSAYS